MNVAEFLSTKFLMWKPTYPISLSLSLTHTDTYHSVCLSLSSMISLIPRNFHFFGTVPWLNQIRLFIGQKAVTSDTGASDKVAKNGNVEFSNWMVADYDRSVSVSRWMEGNRWVDFRVANRLARRVKWMKAVTRHFSLGYRGQCSGGEGIDFRGVHTNIGGYRKKRVARWRGGSPWEAIIKQQVVASSRKFMSDARCGTIHPFRIQFLNLLPLQVPPPTRLLFANPPFPSIDPTARGKRQLIVKKKKKGRRVINNAERGAACQPAVKVNLEPFLPPSCPYFDQD